MSTANQFRRLGRSAGVAAMALVAASSSAQAVAPYTVGNPLLPGAVDTAAGVTFIVNQGFGSATGQLSTFSFLSGSAGDVTPLLFTRADTGQSINFTLAGIGATRNVGVGVNTFDFGLTQGSQLVSANSFFGFRTVSTGVVDFNYQAANLPGTFIALGTSNNVSSLLSFDPNNQSSNTSNGLNFRAYSINATVGPATPSAVPEPFTWAMMLTGFGMIGTTMRLRRRRSVGPLTA